MRNDLMNTMVADMKASKAKAEANKQTKTVKAEKIDRRLCTIKITDQFNKPLTKDFNTVTEARAWFKKYVIRHTNLTQYETITQKLIISCNATIAYPKVVTPVSAAPKSEYRIVRVDGMDQFMFPIK